MKNVNNIIGIFKRELRVKYNWNITIGNIFDQLRLKRIGIF